MLVFGERGKPEYPGKNLSKQSREPTNSTHLWRSIRESNTGHIGGRPVLSPLRQHCSRFVKSRAWSSRCFGQASFRSCTGWACWWTVSGCLCWCPISPIDRPINSVLVNRIWICQIENALHKFITSTITKIHPHTWDSENTRVGIYFARSFVLRVSATRDYWQSNLELTLNSYLCLGRIQQLVRGFASDWKRSIENINQEIMRSFSNFKNGTAILQVRFRWESLLKLWPSFRFLRLLNH